MPTPFPSRQTAPTGRTGGAKPKPTTPNQDWRCKRCRRLLGVCQGDRVHVRFGRGHEYLVGRPVTATCRNCGTLNELAHNAVASARSRTSDS